MTSFVLLIALVACAEPDPVDDDTAGGATDPTETATTCVSETETPTETVELCREVVTDYSDPDSSPAELYDLEIFYADVHSYYEVEWETWLGSEATARLSVSVSPTRTPQIVETVADGSEEAVHPCLDGPVLRASVVGSVAIGTDYVGGSHARATLHGYALADGERVWLSDVRSDDEVELSDEWQALLDTALAEDCPGAAPTVAVEASTTERLRVTVGAELDAWENAYWAGTPEEGDKVPAD